MNAVHVKPFLSWIDYYNFSIIMETKVFIDYN